jgi:hypothetical protein
MYTPILVGVADIKNASISPSDAQEPAQLMLSAISSALNDTGLNGQARLQLQSELDSIDVVRTWTWPYADLPGLLAEKLGMTPKHKHYSENGGNQPAKLVDITAQRVARGETKAGIVVGGEALASCRSRQFTRL